MDKDGGLTPGKTPCAYCGAPSTSLDRGQPVCAQCVRDLEKRGSDLKSQDDRLDRLAAEHGSSR